MGNLLIKEGFRLKTASTKTNKLIRLLDMLFHVVKYRKYANFVLIDTYSTSNFYFAYLVSQLCRFFNLRYIPILRGGNLAWRLKRSPNLSKSIFNNSYRNVAPSLFLISYFENAGFENLVYIPNNIAIKNYKFQSKQMDNIKLLWVRSFSEFYNPQLAVKLLKTLRDDGMDASLCMIGPDNDGSLIKTEALAKALKLNVEFTGLLSKEDWHDKASKYNIFINTTNIDNTPVSVIEAMALGLPVVSTNVGGMPFLIEHGVDGILVEPNDVNTFKTAIKNLIENKECALRMSQKARRKVEQFDWDIIKEKWISLLS